MIVTIIAALMLIGCWIDGLPYGYFQILRWVVCGVAGYRAFLSFGTHAGWAWFFGITAILFNPIIPFYLAREMWLVIDTATAVGFFVSLGLLRKEG